MNGRASAVTFKIKNSYAIGVVEGIGSGPYSNSGGIAGWINSSGGAVENCYAWAGVSTSSTSRETAGGIAGTSEGTISKCYAAGTVQSKGHDPYTVIGGIAGDGPSSAAAISGCMTLVTELDGGLSALPLQIKPTPLTRELTAGTASKRPLPISKPSLSMPARAGTSPPEPANGSLFPATIIRC
jgi:hypothetical protein